MTCEFLCVINIGCKRLANSDICEIYLLIFWKFTWYFFTVVALLLILLCEEKMSDGQSAACILSLHVKKLGKSVY